jgi:hypothetical protein
MWTPGTARWLAVARVASATIDREAVARRQANSAGWNRALDTLQPLSTGRTMSWKATVLKFRPETALVPMFIAARLD